MGLKALWGNRYVAVGLAFWFALVFGAFPTTGPSLVLGESLAEMGPALVPVYSGVCVAVALPLLAMRLPIGRAAFKLMVCACCLQYLGAALVVGSAGGSAVVSCVGGFAYGSGNACSIFAWGILLVRCEDDVRESAFLAALPIAGLILLAMDSLFGGHSLALILLLPLLSLVCFGKSEVAIGPVTGEADYSARGNVAHRPVVVELLKLVVVFGLMGFIWRLYAVDTTVSPTVKGVLFSLGFILAAVVLKLFVAVFRRCGCGVVRAVGVPDRRRGAVLCVGRDGTPHDAGMRSLCGDPCLVRGHDAHPGDWSGPPLRSSVFVRRAGMGVCRHQHGRHGGRGSVPGGVCRRCRPCRYCRCGGHGPAGDRRGRYSRGCRTETFGRPVGRGGRKQAVRFRTSGAGHGSKLRSVCAGAGESWPCSSRDAAARSSARTWGCLRARWTPTYGISIKRRGLSLAKS